MAPTHSILNRHGFDVRETYDNESAIVRREDNAYILGEVSGGAISLYLLNRTQVYSDVEAFVGDFDAIRQQVQDGGADTDFRAVNPIGGSTYDHRALETFKHSYGHYLDDDVKSGSEVAQEAFKDFIDEVIEPQISTMADRIADEYGVATDIAALWLADHYQNTAYYTVRDRAAEALNNGRIKADIARILYGRSDAMKIYDRIPDLDARAEELQSKRKETP